MYGCEFILIDHGSAVFFYSKRRHRERYFIFILELVVQFCNNNVSDDFQVQVVDHSLFQIINSANKHVSRLLELEYNIPPLPISETAKYQQISHH